MTPLPDRLAEIQERVERATPTDQLEALRDEHAGMYALPTEAHVASIKLLAEEAIEARQDIPFLLDLVEKLSGALERIDKLDDPSRRSSYATVARHLAECGIIARQAITRISQMGVEP